MAKKGVMRSIGAVMIIMLAGKLLSLVSNQVYMSYFGSDNVHLNIYSFAVQIPNYIFQSVGTALSGVVIPVYAALLAKNERKKADGFASNIITVSSLATVILIILGIAASFVIPSFTDYSDKPYVGTAIRIMMPVMLFYCLNYIYQGILQSLGDFISPALVNLPSGILIIAYILLFAKDYGVTGLLITTVIGLFMQFAVMLPSAVKHRYRYRPVIDLKDENLRTAIRMTGPVILGACAYQFNMFCNNLMMTNAAPHSVTLFNFVQNLIISSVMTIVLAITSVMYPTMASKYSSGDNEGFRQSVSETISGMSLVLVPVTFGLMVLRTPFLSLISEHGEITASDIKVESAFLLMYCFCLCFLGIKEIADRAFYSMRQTKISAITGVTIMVINVILGYILSKFTPLCEYGIPLAYSVAAIIGTLFLLIMLRRKVGKFGFKMTENLIKTVAAGAVMALFVYGASVAVSDFIAGDSVMRRALRLAIPTVVGVAVYLICAVVLKIPALKQFLSKLSKRGKNEV
ncbi:MAG: lipid II flippase MurJ [Clostridia bacterium]|nr:lipid II flippase MurJ [Clostridia bacterium]